MSANKLFLIQNPPTVLNNIIPSSSENTSLYTQRGQYNSIVRYKERDIQNVDLGTLYSDEFRLSTINFVDQALIKELCSTNVSLGNYLSGEYTISNINNINLIIKELKSKNIILNFPRLNIR
jgi:hypothetical protein